MVFLQILFYDKKIYNYVTAYTERKTQMKKALSIVLTLLIISGLFGCLTTIASAEQEVWESTFIADDFEGDTENIYSDKFFAYDGSTSTAEVTSIRSFSLNEGFGVYATLNMSNSTANYLGEYCSMTVGNISLRIENVADSSNYSAKVYIGYECIGSADLSSAPNGKYRLCVNGSDIWVILNHDYLTFKDSNGVETDFLKRNDKVNLSDAHLSFSVAGNGSSASNRSWEKFMLYPEAATKYVPKDVYLRLVSYEAGENAYFIVPERTTIYTGDRIHMSYSAYSLFTWPDGHQQTEWNMRADNGQKGQPANGYYFTFLNAGEHYIFAASISPTCKMITFDVTDRFFAPTSAQEEESSDHSYPDGSSLPFTDKLVSGDSADFYNNPAESGTYFTSDIWQAVPLISQELIDKGYSGGEGCQLVNSVSYGNDGQLAFLGTDVGGMYKSTDGGSNWYPCTVGFDANGATSIVVDPKNNNKVLCVGASSGYDSTNGIYMSTDAGETWKFMYSVEQNSDGKVGVHGDNRIQLAYDVSSYDEELGYCTTVYWSRENNTSNSEYNNPSIYKSTDGGYTWNIIENTSSYGGGQIRVSSDTGWVFVTASDGIYRSKDGGVTWEHIFDEWVGGFDMVTDYPSNLYASNWNGYHVSTDYGETWDSFVGNNFETSGNTTTFAVSPVNPDNVILQQYYSSYNYKCFYSNDGGHNWGTINIDTTGMWTKTTGASIHTFAWNPVHKNTVITSGWGGIYKSINGGANFFWSNAGFNSICGGGDMNFSVNHPDYISIASQDFNGGYSTDGGKTWTYVNWSGKNWGGFTYGSYMLDENTIITGVSEKMNGDTYIAVTHDGGKTVTRTSNLISGKKIGLGVLGNDQIAFLGEWRTADGGETFEKMENCSGVFTIDKTTGRLFGSSGGTVVTSTDNGETWTALCKSLTSISDIAYSPSTNTLYVVNGTNLYLCTVDFSSTENELRIRHFGQTYANTVAVDPNNEQVVYVGCSSNVYHNLKAIWRSLDGGNTWTNLTRAAGDGRECADGGKQPICIRVNPNTGELFVLTGCRGVWKIAAPPQWYLDANIVHENKFGCLKDMVVADINENSLYNASGYGDNQTYYIYTKQDFYNIRYTLTGLYILMNDIEFTGADFQPGGDFYNAGKKWSPFVYNYNSARFTGIFYGNGYTIKGLQVADSGSLYCSIFGYNGGLIMNTGFVDCLVDVPTNSPFYSCLITAQNYGQILNCYVKDCTINSSSSYVSFISGFGSISGVAGCYVHGTFNSKNTAYPIISWVSDGEVSMPNYYLNTLGSIAAKDHSEVGTALTAEQMKHQASYADFDFDNVWTIDEGNDLPTLRHLEYTEEASTLTAALNVTQKKMRIGSVMQASVSVTDENGQPVEPNVRFYTTTPDIVSVSETGEVTALSSGTGYVYAAEYGTESILRLTLNISPVTMLGDANENGKLESLDMLLLQQHSLGIFQITGTGWYNCDINSDTVIDAADLALLQLIILGYKIEE